MSIAPYSIRAALLSQGSEDRSNMAMFDQDRSSSESDFDALSREEIASNQANLRSESEQFRRRSHPPATLRLLKKWLHAHRTNPYPNDDEKTELCRMTNLDRTQLNNWFINARRRILFRADGEQEGNENQNTPAGPGRSHQQRVQEAARSAAEALTQLSPRHKKKNRAARRCEPYQLPHGTSTSCSPSSPCSPSSSCSSSSESMDSPIPSPVKVCMGNSSMAFPGDPNFSLADYPPFNALLFIVGKELSELNQTEEQPMIS